MKMILAMLLAVMTMMPGYAYAPADSVKVYFRVGQRQFDPELRDNGVAMDRFIETVGKAMADDNIQSISVSGYASPEGTSDANERLARLRCETVADYVSHQTGISRSSIQTIPGGIAWDELRRMVAADPKVPCRTQILNILDNTPVWIFDREGQITDGRKARLMRLDGGEPYRWMLANLFPELRNAVALTVFFKREMPAATMEPDFSEQSEFSEQSDLSDESDFSDESDESDGSDIQDDSGIMQILNEAEATTNSIEMISRKPFYMAAKTNMLYDAALVPNLGAEFYLGKDISLYGEWMYAWWDSNPKHRYWRVYGGDLGLRWWFGRKAHEKPLTGHHVGLYGGVMTFDFEMGDTGYMGGKPGGTLWDRCLVYGGVEYGYSLPVAKRLNIDFSIGVGYMGGNYIKYFPFDNDYYFDKEYKMQYFGPTKAEISLVWLIGRGNTNKRKGGGA